MIDVGLRLSYEDLNLALASAERLDNFLKRLQHEKISLKFDDVDISRKILSLKRQVDELKDSRAEMKINSKEYKQASADIKELQTQIRDLTRDREELRIDTKDANANLEKTRQQIRENEEALRSLEQTAQQVEGVFRTIGSGISTAGGVLQRMGDIFGGRVVNTAKTMATAFGTMGLYSAAQGTVQRYDTMRMFPKMMEHLGYSAEDATAAVTKLEDAVIGLPTGLDEIVASARQLIPLTGDLDKGVNLAIAANNAFLAGGSDAQSVNYGQRQIKDLLAKGTLRSQEWDSLFTALGSGLGVIAEEMGYSAQAKTGGGSINDEIKYAESRLKSLRNTQKRYEKEGGTAKAIKKNSDAIKTWEEELKKLQGQQDKSLGSFRAALKSNQIGALEFLDALERVGTGEGELAQRADDYKDTISAAARNIKNAMQKLGAAGLEALDNILVERTGKGIPGNIREISDSIKQNLVPALEGWVSDNGDKIVGFFDKLKNYDWTGLVSKVGKGLAQYYDFMTTLFTKVSPKIVAWLAVWAGPVGRALQTFGGFISGLGPIAGKLVRVFGMGGKGKAVAQAAETAAQTAGSIGKVATGFKNAFAGLGLAAGGVAVVAEIGGVIAEYAKVMEMISNLDFGPNLGKNMKEVAFYMSAAGVVVEGLAGFFGVLTGLFPGFAPAAAIGEGLAAGAIAIIGEIGGVIAEYVNIIDKVATMEIPSDNRISELGKTISALNSDVLGKIKKVPDKNVRSMENLAEITEYTVDIAKGLKSIKEVGQVGDMSKRVGNIIKATDALLSTDYDYGDKKKSGVISNTFKNLADSTASIKDIATNLTDANEAITNLTKNQNMTNMKINIGIILESLFGDKRPGSADGVLEQFQFKTSEYETIKDNLEKFTATTESIASIVENLVGAKDNIAKLVKKDHGHLTTDIGSQISAVIGGLSRTFLDKNNKLIFNTSEYQIVSDNLGRFSAMTESIATIASSLAGSMANLNTLTKETSLHLGNGKTYGLADSDYTKKLTVVLKSVKGFAKDLTKWDIDTSGEAKEKLTALSDVVGLLPDLITDLSGIQEPINGLGVNGEDWTLGDNITTIVEKLKSAFSGIADADYNDLEGNASSLSTAVSHFKDIVETLQQASETINGLVGNDMSFPIGDKLLHAFTILKLAFGIAKGTAGGEGSLGEVAPALQDIAKQLGEIGKNGETAATNLSKAGSGVNELGEAAKTHGDTINKLAGYIKALKSALSGISSNASGAAGGVDEIGNAAARQVGNLYSAASAAQALASAINNMPSSKTVSLNVAGNATNAITSGSKNLIQQGIGWIASHFASGGEVRGPSGIDNVPAWLTNGEFVMTKRAHTAFGSSFMNRINNLDVEGAMRALSLRAGSGILSRAKVTNNYTRDNHANVTFNVNRATQGYAQRRASRWARALS